MSAREPDSSRGWDHTLAPFTLEVDARRGHQHIVDDGEAAFAAHPLASPREDASIVEDGSLVEQDASAVDKVRKWHLVRVEIVERRISPDLVGLVAQDIEKRVGGKEDVGFRGEVWRY